MINMHNKSITTNSSYHLSLSDSLIAKFEIAEAMTVGNTKNAGEEGINKINNKEVKLNDGKVEGDINNGIEGRVKKKIQTEGIVERPHRNRENVFGS